VIRPIVMWRLLDAADASHFTAQLDSCRGLVPGMLTSEVATRTADLEANCDVVFYSAFEDRAALAACQNHPHHQHISSDLGTLCQTRTVLDHEISGDHA
jgi:quinol monooxygenase YgiN